MKIDNKNSNTQNSGLAIIEATLNSVIENRKFGDTKDIRASLTNALEENADFKALFDKQREEVVGLLNIMTENIEPKKENSDESNKGPAKNVSEAYLQKQKVEKVATEYNEKIGKIGLESTYFHTKGLTAEQIKNNGDKILIALNSFNEDERAKMNIVFTCFNYESEWEEDGKRWHMDNIHEKTVDQIKDEIKDVLKGPAKNVSKDKLHKQEVEKMD